MAAAANQSVFGDRPSSHTVIIARGSRVRQFTIRPWIATTAMLFVSVGALSLGAYGVIGATNGWFAPISAQDQTETYETRISMLRTQIDRLVSRKLLDQETVAGKVDTLLGKQTELAARYEKLRTLLDRAASTGLVSAAVPVPEPKPSGMVPPPKVADTPTLSFRTGSSYSSFDRSDLIDRSKTPDTATDHRNDSLRSAVSATTMNDVADMITRAETAQINGIGALAKRARMKTETIASVLRSEGIVTPRPPTVANANEGGPFVPVPKDSIFDAELQDLSVAIEALETLRASSFDLPLRPPVTSNTISSTFGVRADPFLGQAAMHPGIDFVALPGAAVTTTAPGKVIAAGDNGSYGRMVEIDHGNGLTTRYAHLSEIRVAIGEKVTPGDLIGRVGSTGRSTGPHLHYEVRHAGEAIDPARYLRAGRRIEALG